MAQAPDLISLFIRPLNDLALRYMVTGAVAAVIYGEPRLTRDVDLVLDLGPHDAARIAAAFPADAFYVPPGEVIEQEARRPQHGHFNVIHQETTLKADCYLTGTDPLHEWAMGRRIRHDVGGIPVFVAPIEYVILRKLEWYREAGASRHLEDIRAMLRVSGAAVDRAALSEWITRLELQELWALVSSDQAC